MKILCSNCNKWFEEKGDFIKNYTCIECRRQAGRKYLKEDKRRLKISEVEEIQEEIKDTERKIFAFNNKRDREKLEEYKKRLKYLERTV